MKYQFKIKKFIEDLSKSQTPDLLIISVMRSAWIYKIIDKIYEFKEDDRYVKDVDNEIIIWKDWCIPFKE